MYRQQENAFYWSHYVLNLLVMYENKRNERIIFFIHSDFHEIWALSQANININSFVMFSGLCWMLICKHLTKHQKHPNDNIVIC